MGAGVVFVSSIRYGLSGALLLLGIVLAIVFGGLAVIGAVVQRRISVE